ncbi:MAG TPA: hypothetical protein VLK29_07065, partial [Luteimonas sp.]|nr:hypothetical protein [Luteimonas sp.]
EALAAIAAGNDVTKENAEVIASALRTANIDLVGGDGGLFESFSKALSLGKAIEGFSGKSPVVQDLMERYLGVPRPAPRVHQGDDGVAVVALPGQARQASIADEAI